MDDCDVVRALAALAQGTRLKVFRQLVVSGPQGLTPGALLAELPVGAATVSFHLKELMRAGLVASQRQGRHIVYRVNFDAMSAVLGFLTAHCCEGRPCEVTLAFGPT